MKFAVQRTGTPVGVSDDFFHITLLAVLTAVTWGLVTSLALLLHRNFLTIACDTAVLQSGLVNTLHGHWFANNGAGGPNILGSHTTFLLLLLIPFYVVAPFPETLFILQTAGVFSTVFPLYLLARDLGQKPRMAFIIAATGLASSFLIHMAMAPFHLETWIAAAALWAYHFYQRNNLVGFAVSFLVAVGCGEQAALIFVALGISLLLVRDDWAWRRRFGWLSLIGGVAWLIFAVEVVSPWGAEKHPFNIFAYNYAEWGVNSASGLPSALLHDPRRVLELLFNWERWGHLVTVGGLFVVAAFFSLRSLLLLLPLPAYLLMSDQEFNLYFHAYYYSFVFFAGYVGLLHLLRRFEATSRPMVIFLSVFWLAAVMTLCASVGYYFQLVGGIDEPFSTTLRQEFALIPPSATVYGPHRYSVYLSNRENLVIGDMPEEGVDFDAMMNAEFDKTNVHPEQVDYIVSDFYTDQCGWRRGFMSQEQFQARSDAINRLVTSGKWQRFWSDNDVVILKRVR